MLLETYRKLVQATVEFSRNVFAFRKESQDNRKALVAEELLIKQRIAVVDVMLGPIPESALKPKPPPPRPQYMFLSDAERIEATDCCKFIGSGGTQPVVTHNGISVTKDKLRCLCSDREWLNDEVINFYFELLNQQYAPHVYLWNSFFWLKLSDDGKGYSYKAVQRWTTRKKIDIFSYDRLIVPMNIGKNHWALGLVDFKKQTIMYYDSLAEGCVHNSFANYIKKYLVDEWNDKKGQSSTPAPDFAGFQTPLVYPPQQNNSFDCGVFTCMTAECLAGKRDWIDFDQSIISDMRKKMLLQIRSARIA